MALSAEQRKSYGEYYIMQAFEELVGRQPTAQEIAEFFPSMGSDPNIHDTATMRARVAEYSRKLAEEKRPEEEKKKRLEEAKGYYGGTGDLIRSTLGREPTQQEIEHFSNLKAEGFDDYELQQALQSLPEYVERQDTQARDKLRTELSAADQNFFQKNILPSIQSRFAAQGRTVDSSGFASALANAAKDMGTERETYLAGLGRSDYENRRQLALDTWLGNLSRNYAQQDYSRARADQLADTYRQRSYDLADYDMEKRAYDEYLRNYGRRKKSGLMGGAGSLIGMGLGAALAAPTGGMSIPMGAMLGGSIGGAGGSMFDSY